MGGSIRFVACSGPGHVRQGRLERISHILLSHRYM